MDPFHLPLQEPQIPFSPHPSSLLPLKAPISCGPVPTLLLVPETRQSPEPNEQWDSGSVGRTNLTKSLSKLWVPFGQRRGLQVGSGGKRMERNYKERAEEVG